MALDDKRTSTGQKDGRGSQTPPQAPRIAWLCSLSRISNGVCQIPAVYIASHGDKNLKVDLSEVKYCVLIKGTGIKVRKYESETDYSAVVEETFEKFKQGAVKDYRVNFSDWPEMNHIEAKVLDFVAQLYPNVFSTLDNYCAKHGNYLDETIADFDREIQFYIAYLELATTFKRAGLEFCYPKIVNRCKEVYDHE
jgi:DNA mismatch repair protein MutS